MKSSTSLGLKNKQIALRQVQKQQQQQKIYEQKKVTVSFSSLGTMHIVATNIIVWIRTLIKESLHEITESEEEAHKVEQAVREGERVMGLI